MTAPSPEFERLLQESGQAGAIALRNSRAAPIQLQYVKSDIDFLGGFEAGATWSFHRDERRLALMETFRAAFVHWLEVLSGDGSDQEADLAWQALIDALEAAQ